jgi:TonB-linked SusC/RagA family outer membrane protein
MKKKLQTLLWVLALMASHAYAQTRTVTGTVTGKGDGLPLPGVSVLIAGTHSGTQTAPDGVYSIKVSPGQKLVFEFIGFTTQTLSPSANRLDVVLSGLQSELNEVQVVGYGSTTKRENIGNTSTIKGTSVINQPVQNFQQALAGRAAGVQITIPNGVSNTTPVFRIRGTSSISLSSQPLFVVDGVPVLAGDYGNESGGSALANIDPNDIESIDVAKDGVSTAIYGSRAGNGVVFITTKKGKKGDAVVTLDAYTGFSKVYRLPKVLNAAQYIAEKNEALVNAGIYNETTMHAGYTYDAAGNPIDTDWGKLIYQTGNTNNVSLSMSGGTDKTTYYASGNFSNQNGILRRDGFKNKGLNFNIDHKANKYITIGAKVSYVDQNSLSATSSGSLSGEAYSTTGLGRLAVLLPSTISPYNADGSYNVGSGSTIGIQGNTGFAISYPNPIPTLDLDRQNAEISHTSANIYLQVKPVSWITLKTLFGADYIFQTQDGFVNPVSNWSGTPLTNTASSYAYESTNKRYVWTNTAQFDHTFFGKHSISLLLGNEQNGTSVNSFQLNRATLSDPAFNIIQAGYATTTYGGGSNTQNYLVSFFGRLNYNFDQKYYLTGSLRRDGYSAFGVNSKYGFFPAVGASWVIDQEKFWSTIGADKIFSSFKLRGSYAQAGNNNGLGDYASYTTYSATGLYNGAGTLLPNATGNNAIAWETSKKTDIGFNFGVLQDRVTLDAAFYYNNINGLIYSVPAPPSAGLPSNPSVNVGSMWNRGLEFDLNAQIVRSKDFRWSSNFNISFNQNQVTGLTPGITQFTSSGNTSEIANITQVGQSIGNLWIIRTAGVDPTNGHRIFLNAAGRQVEYSPNGTTATPSQKWYYTDGTAAPAITQATDATNYGNTNPKEYGGFSNSFQYKNFDLNVLFTYQLGFNVYYGTQATLTDQRFWNNSTVILDHWTTPGQNAKYPQVVFGDNVSNGTGLPSDFNVYKGDFVKFKTVAFGYTIPKTVLNKIGLSSMRIYVSAQNLFIITKYPGSDPEISSNGISTSSQGVDRNTSGLSRTFTAGVSVKF